jgi:hypothetical protein
VTPSRLRRVERAGRCPIVCVWIVSASCVEIRAAIVPTPDDHFAASPHCSVTGTCRGCVVSRDTRPLIGGWVVSAAVVQIQNQFCTPNDHLGAGPDATVEVSR